MKGVQNLYINYLKTKTSKNFIIELFFKFFKYKVESIKFLEIFSPMISKEEKIKITDSIYNASIFELSDSGQYFNNYGKKDIKIDDYSNMEKLRFIPYVPKIKSIISNWLEKKIIKTKKYLYYIKLKIILYFMEY